MIAKFGALPPLTFTGRSDSKVFDPVYWIVIPVHLEKSAQEVFRESDSGLRIDPNIVTVLPLWPAYAWYWAQAPVSVGAGAALPPVLGLLEHPATVTRAATPTAAVANRAFRFMSFLPGSQLLDATGGRSLENADICRLIVAPITICCNFWMRRTEAYRSAFILAPIAPSPARFRRSRFRHVIVGNQCIATSAGAYGHPRVVLSSPGSARSSHRSSLSVFASGTSGCCSNWRRRRSSPDGQGVCRLRRRGSETPRAVPGIDRLRETPSIRSRPVAQGTRRRARW
jgi:hypothetical protein